MLRFHFDQIDSTNTAARRLAADQPGARLLVTSSTQSAGRGRHGRAWQSPSGGAWMSIIWPTKRETRMYAAVSLAAAVAVRRAIADAAGEREDLRIKWPNDLLIGDRKVAGILCEQCPGERDTGGVLVIGIGVNVDFDLDLLLRDLRHPATTLSAAYDRSIDVEAVITAVAQHVEAVMEDFERDGLSVRLLEELRGRLAYVGTVRTWASPRGTVTGRVTGLDESGRLLLARDSGMVTCEVGELAGE